MTQPDLTSLYKTRAAARLETAGLLLRANSAFQFAATDEADLARSNIGMMIWSAAIDQGAALLLQERRTVPTGRSQQVSQFITRNLHRQYPGLGLDVAWSMLLQLHNIQHRAGHPPARFARAATAARRSIAALNHLLHQGNQIAPQSYSWLARVRENYVNPFRDEPPTLWPQIQPSRLNTPDPSIGAVLLHWAAQNHDAHAAESLINQGARRCPRQFQTNPTTLGQQKRPPGNNLYADTPRRRRGRPGQPRNPSPPCCGLQRIRHCRSAHQQPIGREQTGRQRRDATTLGGALAARCRSGAVANQRWRVSRQPKFRRSKPLRHSISIRVILRRPARRMNGGTHTRHSLRLARIWSSGFALQSEC